MTAPPDTASTAPLRVVLDTNVVLDLLVFEDPRVQPLAEALGEGVLTAWADRETLRELELVLALPTFGLSVPEQAAVLSRYGTLVRTAPEEPDAPLPSLPRCADRDDQKFLTLAARVGAAWLVSKDKQVLQLAGRHDLPFAILNPRKAAQRLEQRRLARSTSPADLSWAHPLRHRR